MILTERRQQQAIRDAIEGLPLDVDVEAMDKDFKYLWAVVTEDAADKHDAFQLLAEIKIDEPDLARCIDEIMRLKPGQKRHHKSLEEISPTLERVKWLWEGWIPRDLLTVLAAEPGVGKTFIVLDLAHRIISGHDAPDDQPLITTNRNVIFVDGEKFIKSVDERLEAWGTNRRHFIPIERPDREMIDFGQRRYQDELLDMCYDLRPDLVIVDSLATISSTGENNVEDLRVILNFLSGDIAEGFGTAVVLIHHLRKPSSQAANRPVTMHDLRGSSHLVAMGRSIMGAYVPVDDPNGPRRLAVLKTNLCKHPRPLTLRYVPSLANPAIPYVSYSLLEAPVIDDDTLCGECAEWLKVMLEGGPMAYAALVDAGADEGYNETLIQRARQTLDWQVVDTLGKQIKGNQWKLAPSLDEDVASPIAISPERDSPIANVYRWDPLSHALMLHEIDPPQEIEWGGVSHAACVHEMEFLLGSSLFRRIYDHNRSLRPGHRDSPRGRGELSTGSPGGDHVGGRRPEGRPPARQEAPAPARSHRPAYQTQATGDAA